MLAGAAQRQPPIRLESGVAPDKQPPADARRASDRPWSIRAASALGRRALAAWQKMTARTGSASLAAAVDWLLSSSHESGMSVTLGETPCPRLTASSIPTLLALGEVGLARKWGEWLASRCHPAGVLLGNGLGHSASEAPCGSLTATGAALDAWLALSDAQAADTPPIAAEAAGWLAAHIDERGEFNIADQSQAGVDWWGAPAVHVGWLPSLRIAARRLGEPAWEATAERAANHARRTVDWSWWCGAAHVTAGAIAAWLDWGDIDMVRRAMRWPSAAQRGDGGVPARPGSQSVDGAAQALYASIWYRLGERQRADRALAFLRARQLPDGGFPARWERRFRRPSPASGWVAKLFIDASLLEATSAFDTAADLPTEIDADDGRLTAAHQWFTSLGPSPVVADVGCGPGRFLRELGRRFPAARLVGVDPAARYLEMLPAGVECRRGALPRLPARDGEFDAALAIESLEHSLLPERAVAELCRVVRPGGRVLIIDKHRARHPLSIRERWEEWFLPETVAGWLACHCRDVRVRPIAHGGHVRPSGLFVCWEGTRR